MTKTSKLIYLACVVAVFSVPLCSQSKVTPLPVPIPGGDLIAPYGLFNQFFPGVGKLYDGRNADPQGITNFSGLVAMGYTAGKATDNNGHKYVVITDIRVYQGDYIGGVATYGGGGTTSAKGRGTFVEI